jgi:hypothetical protein
VCVCECVREYKNKKKKKKNGKSLVFLWCCPTVLFLTLVGTYVSICLKK